MIVPNLRAQRFIESLVEVVHDPSVLSVNQERFLDRDDLSSAYISERASDHEILHWYGEIAQLALRRSPTR